METKKIKEEIAGLPVDLRADLADFILETLNRPDPDVQQAWAKEARRRLEEYEAGNIEALPGEQVHQELRQKYAK